jgi:sterol desaturase/sphingolipid hydroxylase (fatty acid hydroxylase superfamily)
MQTLIDQLAHFHSSDRAVLIVAGFVAFWILETSFGSGGFPKARHARTNLVFWATTLLVNLAFAAATLSASVMVTQHEFGLLKQASLPLWLNVLVAIAGLDFLSAYCHHQLAHHVPLLWRLHVVHHSDPHVDSTTALRHNPLEAVMRALFTLFGVVVLGVEPGVLIAYQAIALLSAQWIHSDIHLPAALDRALSTVLVSPGMHRVHHHRTLPWTDTNYGTVFSLWDRLFGTFAVLDSGRVTFGVDSIPDSDEREASALRLLLLSLHAEHEGYRPPHNAGAS